MGHGQCQQQWGTLQIVLSPDRSWHNIVIPLKGIVTLGASSVVATTQWWHSDWHIWQE